MSVTFEPIHNDNHGPTFFCKEPGINPVLKLQDIPHHWTSKGALSVNISIVSENGDTINGVVPQFPTDRLLNKDQEANAPTLFVRKMSANGAYEIPIKKNMTLSSAFKGQQKELPRFYIKIQPVHLEEQIVSDYFVVMTKRQPQVLNRLKRGVAEDGSEHVEEVERGTKRQRTTELNKELASNNRTLTASLLKERADKERIENEHRQMKQLLQTLVQISKVGQHSQAPNDIHQCFDITVDTVNTWHFMKTNSPDAPAATSKRRM